MMPPTGAYRSTGMGWSGAVLQGKIARNNFRPITASLQSRPEDAPGSLEASLQEFSDQYLPLPWSGPPQRYQGKPGLLKLPYDGTAAGVLQGHLPFQLRYLLFQSSHL